MSIISGTWRKVADTARLQRSSHSMSVIGSQAWIFGGELQPRQPVDNQFDLIDLSGNDNDAAAKTIPAHDNAPIPRVGPSMVTLQNELYLFSGRGGLAMKPIEEDGALWRHSPTRGQWDLITPADPKAAYPAGRSYHASTTDGAENIYISAGCPESGRLCDLWSFNVAQRAWRQLPDAPPPGRGGSSLAFVAGKIYRMNGFDGSKEIGGAVDVFDTASSTWSSISFSSDGPEARSVSALLPVQVGGKQYLATLFGERDPSSLGHAGAGKMLSDIWLFDLESQKWSKVDGNDGGVPAPRGWFDADVVQNVDGKQAIVVHGGLAEDNSRLGDVWMLEF